MQEFIISGANQLEGHLNVQGSKNSVLPILAAALLPAEETVLHNCPRLSDVDCAVEIIKNLGCRVERSGHDIIVDSSAMNAWTVPEKLMLRMRSSVVFLGAIIARLGRAVMYRPGGCELGARPIDLHISSLRSLGVDIDERGAELDCRAGKLEGKDIWLSFPSVGATENIMLAATACHGVTRVFNAAAEPEIVDLQNAMRAMGCRIYGAGGGVLTIEGGYKTHGAEFTVMPDRIATGTWLCAVAATGGRLELDGTSPEHIETLLYRLREAGCIINTRNGKIEMTAPPRLKALRLTETQPYPGFATDLQPSLMALMCYADGSSVFIENMFENRYRHAGELCRMGADIQVSDRVAVVTGKPRLHGASVNATDLRGAAALVTAALAAQGISHVKDIRHIDRGYENMECDLASLGADIRRDECEQ